MNKRASQHHASITQLPRQYIAPPHIPAPSLTNVEQTHEQCKWRRGYHAHVACKPHNAREVFDWAVGSVLTTCGSTCGWERECLRRVLVGTIIRVAGTASGIPATGLTLADHTAICSPNQPALSGLLGGRLRNEILPAGRKIMIIADGKPGEYFFYVAVIQQRQNANMVA
jgi:hypothetical protein